MDKWNALYFSGSIEGSTYCHTLNTKQSGNEPLQCWLKFKDFCSPEYRKQNIPTAFYSKYIRRSMGHKISNHKEWMICELTRKVSEINFDCTQNPTLLTLSGGLKVNDKNYENSKKGRQFQSSWANWKCVEDLPNNWESQIECLV